MLRPNEWTNGTFPGGYGLSPREIVDGFRRFERGFRNGHLRLIAAGRRNEKRKSVQCGRFGLHSSQGRAISGVLSSTGIGLQQGTGLQ